MPPPCRGSAASGALGRAEAARGACRRARPAPGHVPTRLRRRTAARGGCAPGAEQRATSTRESKEVFHLEIVCILGAPVVPFLTLLWGRVPLLK